MKKRGFTLIELLVVIAILAVLVIVAVPNIIKVYNGAQKNTFKLNAESILKSAKDAFQLAKISRIKREDTAYVYQDGELVTETGNIEMDKIKNIKDGIINIKKDGTVYLSISNGKFCADYDVETDEIIISEECEIEDSSPIPMECFITDFDDVTYGYIFENEYMLEDYYDSLDEDEEALLIYDYKNPSCKRKSIVIPEELNIGLIGNFAFTNLDENYDIMPSNITSVVIPNTVRIIGDYAFTNNKIKNLTLSENIEQIGYHAFENNQLTDVEFTEYIEVSEYAFASNQIENLSIGGSIFADEHAFANNKISELIIPDNSIIGPFAFANNQIEDLELGDNLFLIYGAFNNNQLPDDQAFIYDANDNTEIISYGGAKRSNVIIPDGTEIIGSYAFANSQLTSVTIPSSVVDIANQAFSNNLLVNITLPPDLEGVGSAAFMNNQLTSITIPDAVSEIYSLAFSNNQLVSAVIPDSVTGIGFEAFANNQLTSISLPDSLTYIDGAILNNNQLPDNQAFIYDIENDKMIVSYGGARRSNVVIPNGTESIGYFAFANNQLTSVTIPSSVTDIWEGSFNNNQLPDDQAFIYQRNSDGSIDNTTIASYAGAKRSGVVIPNGVITISEGSFSYNSLTSVTIPNSVRSIEGWAFTGNELTNITIPQSVIDIGWEAFSENNIQRGGAIYNNYCDDLEDLSNDAFSYNGNSRKLIIYLKSSLNGEVCGSDVDAYFDYNDYGHSGA